MLLWLWKRRRAEDQSLKPTSARLLGRPLTAAKSSEMKQKGYFKSVQHTKMRITAKLKHPRAGGVSSGKEGPLWTHICSAFAPRVPWCSRVIVRPHWYPSVKQRHGWPIKYFNWQKKKKKPNTQTKIAEQAEEGEGHSGHSTQQLLWLWLTRNTAPPSGRAARWHKDHPLCQGHSCSLASAAVNRTQA